jgi:hypothetical protein
MLLRMTEPSSIQRPSLLWKKMPSDRRKQAADAFWGDESGAAEHAHAITAIAQRLKFRANSVAVLPKAKKIQYLLELPVVPEIVAARLLVSYHFEHQRPLMAAFLDALGVAHENGLIGDQAVIPQEPEKLQAAVKATAASFPAEELALYLSTLAFQDPETWGRLADLPEARPQH